MNHENRVPKSSVFLKMFYQKVQVYFHTVACIFQIELVHDPSLDDLALPPEDKINKINRPNQHSPACCCRLNFAKVKKKLKRHWHQCYHHIYKFLAKLIFQKKKSWNPKMLESMSNDNMKARRVGIFRI